MPILIIELTSRYLFSLYIALSATGLSNQVILRKRKEEMGFTELSSVIGSWRMAANYPDSRTDCLFCMIGCTTGKIDLIGLK